MSEFTGKVKVLTEQVKTVWVKRICKVEGGECLTLRVCGCEVGKEDPVECTQAYQGLRMCVALIKHDIPEGAELQERLFTIMRRRNGYNDYCTDEEMLRELRGYVW